MKKIFLEILALIVILGFSALIAFRILGNVTASRSHKNEAVVSAKIEKTALKIASPTFAILEDISVNLGGEVKTGQTIALLKKLGGDTEIVSTDLFKDHGEYIEVVAPADGILSDIYLAEKSTVKPQMEFLALYTYSDTKIRLSVGEDSSILDVNSVKLMIEHDAKNYDLELLPTLPIKVNTSEKKVYYAIFKNIFDARNFYQNEDVEVTLIAK